jgi:hypothetical protein
MRVTERMMLPLAMQALCFVAPVLVEPEAEKPHINLKKWGTIV